MRCSRQPAGRGFPAWVLGLAIPKRTSYSQGMQKQASIRSVDPVDSLVRRSLYALKMRAKTPPSIRFKKMVTAGLIDSKGRLNRSPRPKMTLGDLMFKNQRASWRGT